MSAIRLSLGGASPVPHLYEVAGVQVVADLALEPLRPFAVPARAPSGEAPPPPDLAGDGVVVYDGPGAVAGGVRQVESRRYADGYRLRVEGMAELAVASEGDWIVALDGPAARPAALVDAVLGPALMLALALQEIWCLHASAVATDGRALAFVGSSGAGKSTLAALASRDRAGWRRLADDLLPVRLAGEGAEVLPCFPQTKLDPAHQWRPPAAGRLPLRAVYLLEPDAPGIELRDATAREAVLALVEQTVAARLFDRDLQSRQLEFCARLAERVAVWRLRLPRRRDDLPAVLRAIRDAEAERAG